MVFVTADLHFNHPGILALERTNFSCIEQHNEFIIKQYNKVVGEEDTCYILGDLGFSDPKLLGQLVRQLNGHKILIKGNHDKFTTKEYKTLMGFEAVKEGPIYFYDKNCTAKIIFSHEPSREAFENPYVINIHGHLHNSDLDLPNFFNVNIARTNYLPVNIESFYETIRKCKNRREVFGKEWYYNFYKFDKKIS